MREIKFRQYVDGQWHYWGFEVEEDVLYRSPRMRIPSYQYTGLKDKNGKEVYEGDVIKCSRGCPHTVEWVKEYGGTFVGGMPAFYLSGLTTGYAWTGSEEVIGNIYETKEERTNGNV